MPVIVTSEGDCILRERQRILAEYRRRSRVVSQGRYANWQPAEILMRSERRRIAARLLHKLAVFPFPGDHCLEIGYGTLGWLGDLISWGVPAPDLHGIELNADRAQRAQSILPSADLRVGDATELPWESGRFRLVIASTVFTSILTAEVRLRVASEMVRVLAPGGAVLWYDFAINNPRNPHVRRINRGELTYLFPTLRGQVRSLTLAPPLMRLLASRSWLLAALAGAVPLLRTHLLAVLVKPFDTKSSGETRLESLD